MMRSQLGMKEVHGFQESVVMGLKDGEARWGKLNGITSSHEMRE